MMSRNNLSLVPMRVLKLTAYVSLIVMIGCEEEGKPGFVGHHTKIVVEIPTDEGHFDFTWAVTEQPDASILSTRDITPMSSPGVFTFIPDATGTYVFHVAVFQYGDELSAQIHTFNILPSIEQKDIAEDIPPPPPAVPSKEEEPEDAKPDDAWLNEEFPIDTVDVPTSEIIDSVTSKKGTESSATTSQSAAPRPGSSIPYLSDRYTIQVTSAKTLQQAEKVVLELIKAGYDAYIQKAYFKETDEVWFRVRVGSYEKRKAALEVSAKISSTLGYQIWIDFIRREK